MVSSVGTRVTVVLEQPTTAATAMRTAIIRTVETDI